ncbi:MAG TPA: beta-galactosidase GalA [Bacteroidales bacterium]|nr:beta-galactosidase GalA [Bacteroidales bacterium]
MHLKSRKNTLAPFLLSLLLTSLPLSVKSQNISKLEPVVRVKECFDADWQFHKGDIVFKRAIKAGKQGGLTDTNVKVVTGEETLIAYTDKNKTAAFKPSDWQAITLPHDWMVEQAFVNDNSIGSRAGSNGYLPGGIGFYRKEFEIPETDKGSVISLEFDGIFRNSTVWVNGHLMGNHLSGYVPSWYDLSTVLRYGKEGKNVVLVKVDATDFEGWWYEGAGIYRHAWLTKTNKLHVARFGTFVSTPTVSEQEAAIQMKTTLKNEYPIEKNIQLISKIIDKNGVVLDTKTTAQTLKPSSQIEMTQNGTIQKPLLWSPEFPNLYQVLTEVVDNGVIIDRYQTTFGVRTINLTTDGFFLNGKLYPIKGTANHQDFAGVGVALPDKLNEYRIKLLKEMGCNGYRCAHNPPTPELLDACDRLGMLVLDENRLLSNTEDGLKDLTTLMHRDRNHPSVFMWNMENEESLEGTEMGARILEKMVEVAHGIDPTRLTTAAMNHGWNDGGYSDKVDVVGYNYGQRGSRYIKDHEQFPKRKMLVTESTSYVSTRGEYEDDAVKCYVSNLGKGISWGCNPGKDWEQIVQNPFLSGTFAWTGFDYRGEPTPYQWPNVTSHFGIMDLCGFPKDGYYAYKAAWTSVPVVHVFPHWTLPGKEGKSILMRAYSNCEEVELFVNGKSAGKKTVIPYNATDWTVIYKPGKVEIKGYNQGKVATKEVVETTSAPAQLALSSDTYTLKADGCDVAVVRIAIKDAKGRIVPIANNLVTFSIDGPGKIIGTGNGNPSSHEPDKASQRLAFNGYCMVLIQSNKTAGKILLKASSENLKGSEISIEAQ